MLHNPWKRSMRGWFLFWHFTFRETALVYRLHSVMLCVLAWLHALRPQRGCEGNAQYIRADTQTTNNWRNKNTTKELQTRAKSSKVCHMLLVATLTHTHTHTHTHTRTIGRNTANKTDTQKQPVSKVKPNRAVNRIELNPAAALCH